MKAISKRIIGIIVDSMKWTPETLEEEHSMMLEAVAAANRKVEMDGRANMILEIRDTQTGKKFKATFPVYGLSEIKDLFNEKLLPDEFYDILDTLKPGERSPEKDRLPGMSWVHMGIKEDGKLMGTITACIVPQSDKIIKAAFAFCRADDTFCKRIGRTMSRARMDECRFSVLNCGSDRYSTIRSFILQFAAGRDPANAISVLMGEFPKWLDPGRRRRNDIPADVANFLMEIKNSKYMDILTVRKADEMLKKDRSPKYETWPIRE